VQKVAYGSIRPTSPRRSLFETLAAFAALGAILMAYMSIPKLGSHPEHHVTTVKVDPAMLRTASTTNDCVAGKVALTFDDGPDMYTEPILEVLRAYGAKATFFVLGSKVNLHPQTIRTAIKDGHLVENHSWDHPHLADLTTEEIDAEIVKTQQAMVATGVPAPTMFRPPFGNMDDQVRDSAKRHGLTIAEWDIDTNDWRGRRAQDIADTVISRVQPGAVVLMHDGTENLDNTLQALPKIIEGIRSKGYCTATLA
jgi:peptidoglycan/xylan/chitin deacetylase (PgdA/CDA1 family)